jgi:hypothetical protein
MVELFRQDHWQETTFEPLPYFATSDEDLWVNRIVDVANLATVNGRVAILDEAMDELLQYFGFSVASLDYMRAKISAVTMWEPAWP